MAKCSICNSRKGKRKCKTQENFICSLCCGEMRSFNKCNGCSFYKDTKSIRNYKKVPHLPLSRMSNETTLQDYADVIESVICQFDKEQNENLNDNIALKLVELLLDKYHFKDEKLNFSNKLEENGFIFIDQAIKEDLASLSTEAITEILGTIYRSIHRHNVRGREYLEFIHKHVGLRIGKGARVIRNFLGEYQD